MMCLLEVGAGLLASRRLPVWRSLCFSFPDSSGGHPRALWPQHPLPVRVSAGTASPVPEAASRPPLPLPSPSTCKQQVEPRPCQWSRLHPPPEASPPPQAWSALNLDLSVPLRPLKGEGVRGEGRRGAKGSSPRPCKGNSGPSREHGTWEASSRRGPASPVRDT